MLINRTPVISKVLRGVGYDLDRRTLELEFVSGDIYCYFEVPDELYIALMSADSHGEFFATHIRDAGFDYQKMG